MILLDRDERNGMILALNDSEQVGSDISRKQEDAVQPATNNLPTALDHYTYPLPANKS